LPLLSPIYRAIWRQLRLCGFISRASALAKSFAKDHFMMLENVFRGSGDIGAILATCGG
jgi:hypothetical protein